VTLNQLRTFLAVADSGSVRAAAEQLVVTQAAVSASMATLQRSMGMPLLPATGQRRLADCPVAGDRQHDGTLRLPAGSAALEPDRFVRSHCALPRRHDPFRRP
jgi:hypothetical protein